MWANADDQGRLPGDPEEIKYAACPNIDHITKADIPKLLEELAKNDLIKVYNTYKTEAIQILDWWEVHRPQWAWPSQYPPPEGWQDHLRYKRGAKEVVKENWFSQVSENNASGVQQAGTQVSDKTASGEPSAKRFHLPKETEEERGKRKEERGNSPERSGELSGEKPSPSPVGLALLENFPKTFGRKPNSREAAYLRDIEKEISAAGATAEQVYDAYKQAAGQNKLHLSYVRAILLKWLGVPRAPPE
ncbi:unnamed protein product [marine sediment metagenome]|uniref:DnaD domain-containing protein n=1 Tax=marine sediment metagenome TaxID=412755 RepID=X1RWL4_9ZZZZ